MQSSSPQFSMPLWDFALAYYAQPQVADICLDLQDRQGANVCLLIAMRWLELKENELRPTQLAELQEFVLPWAGSVVEPLRKLRRLLKEPMDNIANDELQLQLYHKLKEAELLSEKKLLHSIECYLSAMNLTRNSKANNVKNYIELLTPAGQLLDAQRLSVLHQTT